MTTTSATTKSRPVHTIACGLIRAAVWANPGESGIFYNTTFERRFRDGEGEWKSTSGFGRDDLLILSKVADLAHSWICTQQEGERQRSRQRATQENGQENLDSDTEGHDEPEPAADRPPPSSTSGRRPPQRGGGR